MPLVLFWLTPVFLLIVVILLILQEQQKEKAKVFLIDPIILLESLQIARVIGEEKNILQELAMVRRVLPSTNGYIEQSIRLLGPIISSQRSKATLLQHTNISDFLHEYRYENAGRVTSVLFGSLGEVIEAAQDYSLQESYREHQARADQSGFICFAIARRVDAKLIEGRQTYKMLGLIIAEPEVNQARVTKMRYATVGKKAIVVTCLPLGVTTRIADFIFPAAKQITASAKISRQLPPKDRQNILERVTLYGDTTLNDRYEAIQLWRHNARLIYIGTSEQDRDHLPCEHVAL